MKSTLGARERLQVARGIPPIYSSSTSSSRKRDRPATPVVDDSRDGEEEDPEPIRLPSPKLEDAIPDKPENSAAREFLKNAPKKGLWMPLGKEVKVMQCWRCKAFGHRTGDRECPMSLSGNTASESARQAREDPMTRYIREEKEAKKLRRQEQIARYELHPLLLLLLPSTIPSRAWILLTFFSIYSQNRNDEGYSRSTNKQ
jgi:hypothetical protein